MKAEVINVGTELLLGTISNGNGQYLAGRLAELGFTINALTVVGDDVECIRTRLDDAYRNGAGLVILTGGLGPAKDDMIREMLAAYFDKKLVFDKTVFEEVVKQAHAFGAAEITEQHRKQARVPSDSLVLHNTCGTTPGCVMEHEGKIAVLLPGPPREMQSMFEDCVNCFLHNLVDSARASVSVRLKTEEEAPADRVREAAAAEKLGDILKMENPVVETYAEKEGLLIRITASAPTKADASLMSMIVATNVIQILGEDIIKEVTQIKEES